MLLKLCIVYCNHHQFPSACAAQTLPRRKWFGPGYVWDSREGRSWHSNLRLPQWREWPNAMSIAHITSPTKTWSHSVRFRAVHRKRTPMHRGSITTQIHRENHYWLRFMATRLPHIHSIYCKHVSANVSWTVSLKYAQNQSNVGINHYELIINCF